ncbi:arfaptin-1 isoform X2 [Tachysurus fulvidraco]|uniref:arfaptin-1 isoform X2 n=1 Tax=Tachysurus fulvidraco TaxID=1234273 RepID=UPI000F502A5A|nr:arfaptin-1 isoform X2 [Tachysurus fulvidraco]XP_026989827.1 arfaptin-1 isoform X2 [Tachysurus fulvidraco]
MSEASLESEKNLTVTQEEVQSDMDKSVSQSESLTDDTHVTESHINASKGATNLSHERNGEDDEGHQDTVMQNRSNSDRVHTVTKEKSNPEASQNIKLVMSDEACRSPAAELSVSSNGDSGGDVYQHDVSHGPITSHIHSADHGLSEGVTAEGPNTGSGKEQSNSGAVVLADDMKNPAMEKLELVRKWSINTYKCTKQILSEKLGRGSRTVDLELEARIDVLHENKRKYVQVVTLAQTLASQLAQMMQTQRQLGDAFADLSLKTPELHEEFGYNADTQKLLSKNGETLLGAINFFIASINTLVNKTIEDTMINIKQYEAARIEYDAYRTDLEELNLGPRDSTTLPKIEQSQIQFQMHREKYEKMRNDVSIKLRFLEENKVKVLHNQLTLFHNAIAAYFAGNQQHLEQTLRQFHVKLKMPGADTPSWLEEH